MTTAAGNYTDAEAIANRLSNDGQHFEDADGITLDDILVEYQASEDRYQRDTVQWRVYTLSDSSRLVVTPESWDLLDENGRSAGATDDDDEVYDNEDDWQSCCMDVSRRPVRR